MYFLLLPIAVKNHICYVLSVRFNLNIEIYKPAGRGIEVCLRNPSDLFPPKNKS